jgi:hypothetical protein
LYPESECQVNPARINAFQAGNPEPGSEMIVIITDRPFNISSYIDESTTLDQLIATIFRNKSLPGTPLNKMYILHEFISEKSIAVTRGNDVMIRLVSPKIQPEKGTVVASTREFTINGFAFTGENNPVKSVKLNGQEIDYNVMLKFFEKDILLAGGKNKLTIEATDDKGFTTARILEVDYPKKDSSVVNSPPENYFLGIAIDNYKTWPRLSNARNDVINFSKLLEQKFGYDTQHTTLLLDSAASRKNIIRQIRSFLVRVKPNDNVIIYFSGHGNKDQLTDGDYYFIPCEGEADDVSSAVKSTDIIDNF